VAPERHLQLIEKYRVTTSHMVPTQFHRLLALPDDVRRRYDLSSMRAMIHAAAPCPIDIKRRMLEWWGPGGVGVLRRQRGGGTVVSPSEWLRQAGTVGKAWPMSEIKILDEQGNDLPTGEIGTVYMALGGGPGLRVSRRQAEDRGQPSRPLLHGRRRRLPRRRRIPLSARPQDRHDHLGRRQHLSGRDRAVLLTHPKVGDAAVFGIPDEDWGEQVKAVIEPAPGVEAGPALADEIIVFCKDKLAKYKCPKSIDFVETLPRDPNGKLYKRKLRIRTGPSISGRSEATYG
jgi:long-chain acyl-CoA synthetase